MPGVSKLPVGYWVLSINVLWVVGGMVDNNMYDGVDGYGNRERKDLPAWTTCLGWT